MAPGSMRIARNTFRLFALSLLLALNANAAPSASSTFAQIREFLGRDFLGGKKPEVARISMIKEVKDSSGYYYYKHRVAVNRSGGDRDGSFVIYSAKTWGDAANKIFKLHPNLQETWAARLFILGYTKPFPPVTAKYYYLLGVRDAKGVYHISTSYDNRARKGPKQFTEDLSLGLSPGNYTLEIDAEVALGDHPIIDLWGVKDWFSFGKDIYKGEFWSALGISDKILEWALKKEFTRTQIKYKFTVLARVPKLTGMDFIAAENELLGRRLKYRISGVRSCSAKDSRKVLAQSFRPGLPLRANSLVVLKVCSRASIPQPKPTPQAGSKYYIYSCTNGGNSLFLTTPQGIQNVALCLVEGAGNNCSVKATFSGPLAGPYSTLADAQKALCSALTGKHYNKLVPWGPWVKSGGTEYRCFESECEDALARYCPSLPYY